MDCRYKYNGIELSYSIEGEGDAVVLLHGWGCDKSIWKSSVEVMYIKLISRSTFFISKLKIMIFLKLHVLCHSGPARGSGLLYTND